MGAAPQRKGPDRWGTVTWIVGVLLVILCLVWPYL